MYLLFYDGQVKLSPLPSYGANILATDEQVRYLHSMHPVKVFILDMLAIKVFCNIKVTFILVLFVLGLTFK
jgi:hypothetical protein